MKAKESKLLKFLQGEKQFHVPIYQRTYSWLRPQCEQYWNDLMTAGRSEDVEAHFLGAVVYIGRGLHQVSDVSQYLVIDGQQRLTTTSLVLLALARHLGPDGEIVLSNEAEDGSVSETRITAARIRENHLVNRHEEGGDGYFKLMLTQSDRDTLHRLIDGGPLPEGTSDRVVENLKFFEAQLRAGEQELQEVYRGLQKLVIVDVALEQGKDNPQLIFESMNSTGLDLTQADLIRNYVLMGLEPKAQTRLYNDAWKRMEHRFDGRDPQDFDKFVRDFLSLRVVSAGASTPVRLDQVYAAFKRYAYGQDPVKLVQDLAEMSRFYAAILDPSGIEKDAEVRQALLDVAALKLDVVYPFLLQTYADWQQAVIDKAEFLQVLRLVESYLFRRSICGVNSQGLNKLFPDLPRRIDPAAYVQSLQDTLYNLKTYLRFPRDPEFQEALVHRDLYQVKRLCGYTLLKLENFGHKEPISLGRLTIEHVLPQTENLSQEWLEMLGPDSARIQGRYLHTLGNLTLTGYNSELSARPYLDKRDLVPGGFIDSHLRLNADLAKLDVWNEEQITLRAERLAQLAVSVWPALTPSESVRSQVDTKPEKAERSVEDHLGGTTTELRELFEDLRERLVQLHEDVTEHPLMVYVGYKAGANFCDVTVQPSANTLRCWLNMPFAQLVDPTGRARDVSEIGHHGNGDVEVGLRPSDDVEWFLNLAQQALAYQLSKKAGIEEALNSLPEALKILHAQLEQRILELGPKVSLKRNKEYHSFRERQAFCELETRISVPALYIRVKAGVDAEGILEADRANWKVTGWPAWWHRLLKTEADVETAFPAIVDAHERQSLAASVSKGGAPETIRDIQHQLIGAALTMDSTVAHVSAGRTTYLRRGDQDFAYLRKDETAGFVYISGLPSQVPPHRLYLRALETLPDGIAFLQKLYEDR